MGFREGEYLHAGLFRIAILKLRRVPLRGFILFIQSQTSLFPDVLDFSSTLIFWCVCGSLGAA